MQRFSKETNLPHLDKSKFLVPQEITMSQFVTIIRYVKVEISKVKIEYIFIELQANSTNIDIKLNKSFLQTICQN